MKCVHKVILFGAIMLTLVTSCRAPKDVAYFQDLKTGSVSVASSLTDIRIKPEDKLSIVVNTSDPALNALFNLVQDRKRLRSSSVTNLGEEYGYESAESTSYYTVDPDGNISFPVLGKLHVAGLTRYQIASLISTELKSRDLVKDPVVTVEYGNLGVSVIGDVRTPGRYEFNRDRLTLLDALAMAGDLLTTGRRDNVVVIRESVKGKRESYRVDLTDLQKLMESPVYYLQQDDVVYVEPNDKKKREATPSGNTAYSPSFWVSIASVGITVATLIATLVK